MIAAVAAVVFAALAIGPVADTLLGAFDQSVNDAVERSGDAFQHAWDVTADVLVYGVAAALALGAAVEAIRRRDTGHAAAIGLLLLAMAANDAILKPFFDRMRPPTAYLDSPAFPSGHTTAALLVSSAILFPRITPVRLGIVATVTALAAVARVLSGAHWVSDVVASIAYGTLVVALMQTNRRMAAPAADQFT